MPNKRGHPELPKELVDELTDVLEARLLIVEKIGEYKKGTSEGVVGKIDCPKCKVKDGLHFSRSGYNGHIHAKCKTEDCLAWME